MHKKTQGPYEQQRQEHTNKVSCSSLIFLHFFFFLKFLIFFFFKTSTEAADPRAHEKEVVPILSCPRD